MTAVVTENCEAYLEQLLHIGVKLTEPRRGCRATCIGNSSPCLSDGLWTSTPKAEFFEVVPEL